MEEERRLTSSAPRIAIFTLTPLWFFVVYAFGAAGLMTRPRGEPPIPILLGLILPLAVFALAVASWPAFRRTLLSSDPRVTTATQAWRFAGLGFIALYAQGILPGSFAWPAGLGDIAVGLTAPWVVAALVRDPAFVGTRWFVLWNWFGILDLVNAVTLGALGTGFAGRVAGGADTTPMSQLPLVLIPAFFVPLLIMIHVVALLQARQARHPGEAHPVGERDVASPARFSG